MTRILCYCTKVCALLLACSLIMLTNAPVKVEGAYRFTDKVEQATLDNGMTVLVKENHAFDTISMVTLTPYGSQMDPVGLAGLGYVTQRAMLKGTDRRTASDIALDTESQGVLINSHITRDYGLLSVQMTTAGWLQGLDVFLDILTSPSFPQDEVEQEKRLALHQLQGLRDNPPDDAILSFFEAFYGDNALGRTNLGNEAGVQKITVATLHSWYRRMYQPEDMVIVVVGRVDSEQIMTALREGLGSWEQEPYDGIFSIPALSVEPVTAPTSRVIKRPTQAAWMVMGFGAPPAYDPDSVVMTVLNTVLGVGVDSRLFQEMRDRQGLAYVVLSSYQPLYAPSTIWAFMGTHPMSVDQARAGMREEFRRLATEPVSQDELRRAKTLAKGSYLMANESNLHQALLMGTNELLGQGYHWTDDFARRIELVTVDDIQRVAQQYLTYPVETVVQP